MFKILPPELYSHILCLAIPISIFVSNNLITDHVEYADRLVKCFLAQAKQLYGPQILVSNFHYLLHLAEDAVRFGPLMDISAFNFESFNCKYARTIRSRKFPLTEFANRYYENINVSFFIKEKNRYICKYFLMDNKLLLVVSDSGDTCNVKMYAESEPFFVQPCDSRILSIFRFKKSYDNIVFSPTILKKSIETIVIEEDDCLITVPIRHSL